MIYCHSTCIFKSIYSNVYFGIQIYGSCLLHTFHSDNIWYGAMPSKLDSSEFQCTKPVLVVHVIWQIWLNTTLSPAKVTSDHTLGLVNRWFCWFKHIQKLLSRGTWKKCMEKLLDCLLFVFSVQHSGITGDD